MVLIAAYTYQVSDFNFVWAQSRIEFFHSSLFQNLQLLIKKEALLAKMQSHTLEKKNLLKLDITDFFGSISFEQVLCAAFNTRYVSKQVGFLLTSLCCKNDALPQGSPTSPALSNIVMRRFDDQIGRWCNQRQITYTRYCDDMTFSADRPLYGVYKKVKTMLREMGFELNESKTHFISNADRQTVTGLVVNEKLSIPSSYKRKPAAGNLLYFEVWHRGQHRTR